MAAQQKPQESVIQTEGKPLIEVPETAGLSLPSADTPAIQVPETPQLILPEPVEIEPKTIILP
jgi:hypothetical protein